jgi:hypothetical protein
LQKRFTLLQKTFAPLPKPFAIEQKLFAMLQKALVPLPKHFAAFCSKPFAMLKALRFFLRAFPTPPK